jgi:hypothetical protein
MFKLTDLPLNKRNMALIPIDGNTKTTERGGESIVYELKQFYTF